MSGIFLLRGALVALVLGLASAPVLASEGELLDAVGSGNIAEVERLLAAGVDRHLRDPFDRTALQLALEEDASPAILELLQAAVGAVITPFRGKRNAGGPQ